MGPPPELKAPPGSCDCHMHVYDDRYPINQVWPVPPPKGPAADYRRVQRDLGLERVVVVQPNAYGFDNRCTTDAMRDLGPFSGWRCLDSHAGLEPAANSRMNVDPRRLRWLPLPLSIAVVLALSALFLLIVGIDVGTAAGARCSRRGAH